MIAFKNTQALYLDVQISVYKLHGNALTFENDQLEKSRSTAIKSPPQRPSVALRPVDQILDVIDDLAAVLSIFGTDASPAKVIQSAGTQA